MEYFEISNRRYLGSKAKLLNFVHDVVERECGEIKSFADIFGGTGNVAWSFNNKDIAIVVNDLLESNKQSFICFFGSQDANETKIKKIIDEFNSLVKLPENYFSKNFSDTYFSKENCKKIGFVRERIDELSNHGELNVREKAILITSLLYAMDKIANTVGHYDAYRKKGKLDKKMILRYPIFDVRNNVNNQIFSIDANELVKQISADVVYVDPPYNSRQYCDAYHLLENVALWEKPKVVGVAKKMKNRNAKKSKYCTLKAADAFSDLIGKINAKYILVSYNNTGTKGAGRSQAKISDQDILDVLHKKGEVKIFETEHNQFQAGKSKAFEDNKERLFLCIVGDETEAKEMVQTVSFVKSPLNYTGGKYKLLPQIVRLFPKEINTFIDLFGGGFNVGANVNAKKTIYNDFQNSVKRLIKLLYEHKAFDVINKVKSIIGEYGLSDTTNNGYEFYGCESNHGVGSYNKKPFMNLRKTFNEMYGDSLEKDFIFLTLIIFAFNNQIRFNSAGEYNMPVGKRDFNSSTIKNIKELCNKIKNLDCSFFSLDFRKFKFDKFEDPFIYCDPPYLLGVAAYNENDGWTAKEEYALLDKLEELSLKGYKFALSNVLEHKGLKNQALLDWALKNGFNIIHLNKNYSNVSYHKKDKESESDEVLITNYID